MYGLVLKSSTTLKKKKKKEKNKQMSLYIHSVSRRRPIVIAPFSYP